MEGMRNKCRKSVNLRPTQVGESHETGYFNVSTHLSLESRLSMSGDTPLLYCLPS